uniref:Acyl-CoA synthetase n=1 Tax=Panagrolaimus sp. JU765 TaxID=591449 RepID=A0AC34QF01_9BILA
MADVKDSEEKNDINEKKGGGVCCFLPKTIDAGEHVRKLASEDFQVLSIDLYSNNPSRKFRLIIVYIRANEVSSKSSNSLIDELIKLIKPNDVRRFILVGDFNTPKIDWKSSEPNPALYYEKDFLEFVKHFKLIQHVQKATFGDNILDLVLTANKNKITVNFPDISSIVTAKQYHQAICCSVKFSDMENETPAENIADSFVHPDKRKPYLPVERIHLRQSFKNTQACYYLKEKDGYFCYTHTNPRNDKETFHCNSCNKSLLQHDADYKFQCNLNHAPNCISKSMQNDLKNKWESARLFFIRPGRRCVSEPSNQSYAYGASTIPLLHNTIGERLRMSVDQCDNRIRIIFKHGNIRKTYAELFADARQLAASLIHLGVKKGDRVGIWGPNYYEWVVTQFATAMAGMVLVPAYQSEELKFALHELKINVVITPPEFEKMNYVDILHSTVPEMTAKKEGTGEVYSTAMPDLKHAIIFKGEPGRKYKGFWNYDELLEKPTSEDSKELDEIGKKIRFDDPAAIMFTYAIADEKCTVLFGMPTMFIDILKFFSRPELPKADICSLHGGIIAGAPCPTALCERLIKDLKMNDFVACYGSSEALIAAMSYPTDTPEERCRSVGYVKDHIELAVFNKEGELVNRGEKGEVCIRGYSVMLGYFNDEEKTKESIKPDRWYHTGIGFVKYGNNKPRGGLRIIQDSSHEIDDENIDFDAKENIYAVKIDPGVNGPQANKKAPA